jgi:hypothetical protein
MNVRSAIGTGLSLTIAFFCVNAWHSCSANDAVVSNGVPNCLGFVVGGAGFAFSPNTNMLVTTLGYLDNDQASLPAQVQLWDSFGTVLTSAVVTSNSPITENFYLYEPIAPVPITAGQTYFLQGLNRDTNGNWNFWGGPIIGGPVTCGDFLTVIISSDLNYLGMAMNTKDSGEFPRVIQAQALAVGANFQYEVSMIAITTVSSGCRLAWPPGWILQMADSTTGPWTNVPGVTPPYYIPADSSGKMFRLRK